MKAGSCGRAARRHGDGNEHCAGEVDRVASGDDAEPGDEDDQRGGAGPIYGAGLYQGCPRTRALGTWDNQAVDRVFVVAT